MGFYRLLLRLYPRSFRNEYGEEMWAIFAQRHRANSSVLGRAALWFTMIGDTTRNALLAHLDLLRQDLRYTLRTLRRSPSFAATAVVIIALGVGATTAAFSVTDFVLIRPLPFPAPDRLVCLWERLPGYSRMELSPANYRDWTAGARSFERIGAFHGLAVNLVGAGEPQRLEGAAVSFDLFPTLGVEPLIGRLFAPADDRAGAAGTVIISYRLWQTTFGGEASTIGRRVVLDSDPYEVIGVMPQAFRFPNADAALWTTMRFDESNYQDRNDNWLQSVARLRKDVSIQQARTEMDIAATRSRHQYPRENENTGATIVHLSDEVSEQARLLLVALCGAAACVLLIACANLANLLLARALFRRRELAVRTAMGAGRERLVRQLMTENLVLAFAGGTCGVGLAAAAVPLLSQLVPSGLPIADTPTVDVRVLLFGIALTMATGLVFGLAPLARLNDDARATALREGARAGGGRKERLRSALVAAEIVASVVLLVSAGLLVRALWTIQSTDPGFRPDGVLTLRTALPLPRYAATAQRENFYSRVLAEVRALPGVADAAYISFLPMAFRGGIWAVVIEGRPATRADNQVASLRYVTPGFFSTLGIPIKRGRDVAETDTRDRPFVAVVSESFVRRYWPNEEPIGRHFEFAFADRRVIGVVGDVRVRGLERPSEPQVYLSYKQVPDGSIPFYVPKDLALRAATDPTALVPSIRAIVAKIDPQQPVSDVRTMAEIVAHDTASRAVQVRILGAFAAIAFLLAAVGIHGLLSFAVSQRAQEIGVRIALGAQPVDILGMVVQRSAALAAAGVVPGVVLAYAAARAMQALLVGVAPGDVPTFAAAILLAVVMTMVGTLLPTLRAVRVDPITAIRSE